MKKLFLTLVTILLAFSSCDTSSSSNSKKGTDQTPGGGSGKQTGNGDTSKPVEQLPSGAEQTKPELPTTLCEQQPRFANHQFCTEYKINKESYLKTLQFKADCTFTATEYQMSNSQVMSSHVGSWKAQGTYLSMNSATAGSAIRKITAWYGDGLDLNNPSETYTFCD